MAAYNENTMLKHLLAIVSLYKSAKCMFTCSELSTVKSHANTVVFLLTANTPTTHVIPSRGSKMMVLFRVVLKVNKMARPGLPFTKQCY